ncbi:MAG: hypothetical protein WCR01_09430 [Bacteroidota bacterium]
MKRNKQKTKGKVSISSNESLPLLRGMFICPKSIKYLKNASYSEFLRDFFALIDPFQPSAMEQINGKKDSNWSITEEGTLMIKTG